MLRPDLTWEEWNFLERVGACTILGTILALYFIFDMYNGEWPAYLFLGLVIGIDYYVYRTFRKIWSEFIHVRK